LDSESSSRVNGEEPQMKKSIDFKTNEMFTFRNTRAEIRSSPEFPQPQRTDDEDLSCSERIYENINSKRRVQTNP